MRRRLHTHSRFNPVHKWIGVIFWGLGVLGCAASNTGPALDDYKSRYWQGTYYFSVKDSPTSIKCSIDAGYQSPADVPVVYQEQDAATIFTSEKDLEKISALKRQCFEKSKHVFSAAD